MLVVWGSRDAWLPVDTSERITARIPTARREVIESAGHFSMLDAPDRIATELSRFLANTPAPPNGPAR